MTRWNRRFAVAAVRKPRFRAVQAQANNWSARGVRERAVCAPLRQRSVGSTASLRSVSQSLRNTVVES
eukprot:3541660-Lingulodinium_polyedra.AAC.1